MKLIYHFLWTLICVMFISATPGKGEKYNSPKAGISAGISQNYRQYNFFYQSGTNHILFEYSYYDQIFKELYRFAAKDDLITPIMVNETCENVYNSFGIGYTLNLLDIKEKFQINIPATVYSGFGTRERITYSKQEGYVETPDLKNKNYIVFGLKGGISAEFKLYDRIHFCLTNYVDYEMDGLKPVSSFPAGSKLYLWNPFFSLVFLTNF